MISFSTKASFLAVSIDFNCCRSFLPDSIRFSSVHIRWDFWGHIFRLFFGLWKRSGVVPRHNPWCEEVENEKESGCILVLLLGMTQWFHSSLWHIICHCTENIFRNIPKHSEILFYPNTLLHWCRPCTLSDKIFGGRNFSADKIFGTKSKFCSIRY